MISPKYDVVVAGAGIIGLSVAYYLKKKGCDRVLVLEKEESWITGSTPRANGGFRQQFSTPVNIQMSRLSIPVFSSFEKEFGNDRVHDTIAGVEPGSAQEAVEALVRTVVRFSGEAEQFDDLTCLVLKAGGNHQ